MGITLPIFNAVGKIACVKVKLTRCVIGDEKISAHSFNTETGIKSKQQFLFFNLRMTLYTSSTETGRKLFMQF